MNNNGSGSHLFAVILVVFTAMLAGCATTGQQNADTTLHVNEDPLEPANRASFTFNESLDQYLMKPLATGYAEVTPGLVRSGITNFFNNLSYLNVMINSFLQGKIDDGLTDMTRFIFNSTIGLGGLVDVATPMGLEKHNEDTGQTLAVWGAKEGAYLYLPVFGPDTVRDLPNRATSYLLNPLTYVSGTILFPVTALNVINNRANLIESTNIRDEAAVDAYTFTREAYLQRRYYLIHDGNPPTDGYDDIFDYPGDEEGQLIID